MSPADWVWRALWLQVRAIRLLVDRHEEVPASTVVPALEVPFLFCTMPSSGLRWALSCMHGRACTPR